jgi:hypothetical protein
MSAVTPGAGSTVDVAAEAPERELALDMAKRALPLAILPVGACAVVWGVAGAASAAYAVALVVINLLAASWILTTAARIGETAVMGAALFGYLIRLGFIFAAVWPVKDAGWVEPVALGVTLIVTHLGLLVWELRYVSASLAHPGLRPVSKESKSR